MARGTEPFTWLRFTPLPPRNTDEDKDEEVLVLLVSLKALSWSPSRSPPLDMKEDAAGAEDGVAPILLLPTPLLLLLMLLLPFELSLLAAFFIE